MQSEPAAGADAKQIAGTHYKTEYQHWSMLPALGYSSEYYVGQATKYLTRWRKKNGLRDLLKAQHFIEKLAELVDERGAKFLPYGHVAEDFELQEIVTDHMRSHLGHYFHVNEVDRESSAICVCIIFANSKSMLLEAVKACEKLAEAEKLNATDKADIEPPVSTDFTFITYIANGLGIRWQCKACGHLLDLQLNEPPSKVHKTCSTDTATINVPVA